MPIPTPTAATATATSSAAAPSTTCAGQLIAPPTSPKTCNDLAMQYGVTTGDLTVLANDWLCRLTKPVCAPPACELTKVGWGQTWYVSQPTGPIRLLTKFDYSESIRKSISTQSNNVTTVQFSTWNWRIIGKCDDVRGDQHICKGYATSLESCRTID
ncbi:MAG: hypothetical protein Q9198_000565 [Flavoplaca austrocitrina]